MSVNSKLPFKRICFVWRRWGGGALIMCYQPFISCIEQKLPALVLSLEDLSKNSNLIDNSVLFLLKSFPEQSTIDKLKNKKNKIVLIPADSNINFSKEYLANIKNIDGVVVASKKYKNFLNPIISDSKIKIIPHNYDYFLDHTTFKKEREDKFSLYFGGSPSSSPTQGELGLDKRFNPNIGFWRSLEQFEKDGRYLNSLQKQKYIFDLIKNKKDKRLIKSINLLTNPSKYSCHYAVRAPFVADYKNYWMAKSATKLVTAAGSNSNIITSLDPPVRELIDEEYPYAIDTESDDFLKNYDEICSDMILKAKKTFNTKMWYDGLKIMKKVREKTSTRQITKHYINFAMELYS